MDFALNLTASLDSGLKLPIQIVQAACAEILKFTQSHKMLCNISPPKTLDCKKKIIFKH